ncbi:MAG: DUF3037 domain-containing protein [Chloroflexi bacterium]|nr:DUF3037 domain-containing protein [Chloroflexota bacterium]
MPARDAFEYAMIRIVPHVEREEFLNVGVMLLCRARQFFDARIHLDAARLAALAPDFDVQETQRHLDAIPHIIAGDAQAGELAALSQSERFRWLAAPRSTVIQVSPVHGGLTDDPRAELDRLFKEMVE